MHPLCVEGILDRLLIVIKDLSESEHIREQAQQLEQRALLGEVMAIFAHEVRNPINNISTGLELMTLNLSADDPQQELIQRLQQDCDRLADLMKSVLAFSKPVEFTLEPLHIPPLVQKLIDRSTPRLAKAGVKCQLRTEGNIPLILADYRSLEQALSNLIANAFQAMSETGGQLTIKIKTLKPQKLPGLREDIPYVEISIADTGPGIPKEHQDRIFQPFFTTNRNGTGLGLVITRRIITAHKGTIHLSSFPGGTVFYIRLPVAESA
ncbi:MAG: two-component sensor histidine kinase, partial [Chloroflexi bacterium]|nr:two-component sensor histidine kinase [Chloroflexota bacterium]